jgi:transposase
MARIKGPRKIHRYTAEFKLKAVKLSELKGVQVQDVADALDIHPFMLSRWRKEAREGRLRARVAVAPEARERGRVEKLSVLKRQYALLREEHELLKKAIRFCSARRQRSSPSSRRSRTGSAYRHSASAMA